MGEEGEFDRNNLSGISADQSTALSPFSREVSLVIPLSRQSTAARGCDQNPADDRVTPKGLAALTDPTPHPHPRDPVEPRISAAVAQHLDRVWRVLRRSGLSEADADDGAQDVFFILTQRLPDVPPRAERAFLLATALHVAADRRRSAWRRRVTEPLDPMLADATQVWPDEAVEQLQRRALLDRALGTLPSEEREVFVLLELEQVTREEAAEILQIPAGTVASRQRRARLSFNQAVRRASQSRSHP